jgi:hypothetical protein
MAQQIQHSKTEQNSMTISSNKALLQKLVAGDKLAITSYLSKFKERGIVKFEKVLDISMADRIPSLVVSEEGRSEVLIALTVSLKSLFSNFNLRVGLNEDQLVEIADLIIEQSYEDNLSIEDFLLFGQKFLVGDYGKIYDRMDIPTFFEFFEKYRQARHESMLNIREEQHVQFKSMGRGPNISNPIELNRDEDAKSTLELMQTYYDDARDEQK